MGEKKGGGGKGVTREDEEEGKEIGKKVSAERVQSAFMNDLHTAVRECLILYRESYFDEWPSEVQEILVNMMFNLGRPRLSKFKKMHAALNKEDWCEAAKEGRDSLWYRQVPTRAERLMSRLENV